MGFDVQEFVSNLVPVDLLVKIPKKEFEERIERVKFELEKRDVNVAVAYGSELRPGDTGWLTGYEPQIEPTAVVVGCEKTLVLGGPEGQFYAEEMMQVGEFRCLKELKIPEEDYPGFEFHTLKQIFKEACGHDAKKVGLLTTKENLTCSFYELLQGASEKLIDMSDFLLKARYRKSQRELDVMRVAAKISSYAMEALIRAVEPGRRELEVAACGDYVMKYMGADRVGITTIVTSGARVSTVLGRASNKVIKEGEMVLLSTSARYEGLASCLGRTVIAGSPNADQKELLEHIASAYELSVSKLGYDRPAKQVDLSARNYLKKIGLEPLYSGIHNIGWTEAMEGTGAATQYSEYNFPKGISLQLDIGVFRKPFRNIRAERVGIRLEDPYCITHEGNTEKMTRLCPRVQNMVSVV
jgi:Xaa-Pro aminopeptidase